MKVYKHQKYGKTNWYLVDDNDYNSLTRVNGLFEKSLTEEEKNEILNNSKLITDKKFKIRTLFAYIIGFVVILSIVQNVLSALLWFFALLISSFVLYVLIKVLVDNVFLKDTLSNFPGKMQEDFNTTLFLNFYAPLCAAILAILAKVPIVL